MKLLASMYTESYKFYINQLCMIHLEMKANHVKAVHKTYGFMLSSFPLPHPTL